MADKKLTTMPLLSNPNGSVVYGVKDGKDYKITAGNMISAVDAPLDGNAYSRKNGTWAFTNANDIENLSQAVYDSLEAGTDTEIKFSTDTNKITINSGENASVLLWMGI